MFCLVVVVFVLQSMLKEKHELKKLWSYDIHSGYINRAKCCSSVQLRKNECQGSTAVFSPQARTGQVQPEPANCRERPTKLLTGEEKWGIYPEMQNILCEVSKWWHCGKPGNDILIAQLCIALHWYAQLFFPFTCRTVCIHMFLNQCISTVFQSLLHLKTSIKWVLKTDLFFLKIYLFIYLFLCVEDISGIVNLLPLKIWVYNFSNGCLHTGMRSTSALFTAAHQPPRLPRAFAEDKHNKWRHRVGARWNVHAWVLPQP